MAVYNDQNPPNGAAQLSFFEQPEQEAAAREFRDLDDTARDNVHLSLAALDMVKGIGFRTLRALFDSGFLLRFAAIGNGEISDQLSVLLGPGKHYAEVLNMVAAQKQPLMDKARNVIAELAKQDISFVPIGHSTYPASLHRLSDPPRWIFVRGNVQVLHSDSIVAVVGTRSATAQGLKLAYACGMHLAKRNIVVLSGLAKGIDESAQTGATDCYGQSVAVLGHGITATDMPANQPLWQQILETDGAIISEYLPHDPPSREAFLRRNELQVALARALIPVECPSLESGTGATIRRALNIGTPVVGVTWRKGEPDALLSTERNLRKLDIPVFVISTENSAQFWDHVRTILPAHDWSADPSPRQDRLFHAVEQLIVPAQKRLELDDRAIDRLAEVLKRSLRSTAQASSR